jgi:hypothetical protein
MCFGPALVPLFQLLIFRNAGFEEKRAEAGSGRDSQIDYKQG